MKNTFFYTILFIAVCGVTVPVCADGRHFMVPEQTSLTRCKKLCTRIACWTAFAVCPVVLAVGGAVVGVNSLEEHHNHFNFPALPRSDNYAVSDENILPILYSVSGAVVGCAFNGLLYGLYQLSQKTQYTYHACEQEHVVLKTDN